MKAELGALNAVKVAFTAFNLDSPLILGCGRGGGWLWWWAGGVWCGRVGVAGLPSFSTVVFRVGPGQAGG
ncbi:hypothetical protein [Kibdelosporangium philippinense]|uniref:hypothetical protein n=1 Tax=Kibdelosporangium philippinense TaxID=211113 RepID=UPI003609CFFF